jgi:hypothetical protein
VADLCLDHCPSFWLVAPPSMIASAHRFMLGLFEAIALQFLVSVKFSTYRRFVDCQEFSKFSLMMSPFSTTNGSAIFIIW